MSKQTHIHTSLISTQTISCWCYFHAEFYCFFTPMATPPHVLSVSLPLPLPWLAWKTIFQLEPHQGLWRRASQAKGERLWSWFQLTREWRWRGGEARSRCGGFGAPGFQSWLAREKTRRTRFYWWNRISASLEFWPFRVRHNHFLPEQAFNDYK